MKKILLFLVSLVLFISCGKDPFDGEWISKNWSNNYETLKITKNEKTYMVAVYNDKFTATRDGNVLNINFLLGQIPMVLDEKTGVLTLEKDEYIRYDEKVKKEIAEKIESYRKEITGKWLHRKVSKDYFGTTNEKDIVTITPSKEANTVNVKIEIYNMYSTPEKIKETKEGIFVISPTGELDDKNNIIEGFSDLSYLRNVRDFENLKKIQ